MADRPGRARTAALAILAAAALAACSSGPAATRTGAPTATGATAPTATSADASPAGTAPATAGASAPLTPQPPGGNAMCDVITQAEMTTILEGREAAFNPASAERNGCNWTSGDFTVHINVHEDEVGTIDALRLADRNVEELAIGDGGIYSRVARGAYVLKGGRVLAVQVVILPAALDLRDVAVAIATVALPRF